MTTAPRPTAAPRLTARLRARLPLACDAAGALCLAAAAVLMVRGLSAPLGYYDEGILVSNTRVFMRGGWPYADFYTQYPPGIYVVIAALWKLGGVHVATTRALSIVLRLAIAALAGVAAGRIARRRYALLPAGLVLLHLARLEPAPFAWLAGLACAMGAVVALDGAARAPSPRRWLVAGLALGGTLAFRHDLFVYFCAALALPSLVWLRRQGARASLVAAGWLAVGALPPLVVLWLPTLVHVPWRRIYHDLYWDQLHYVLPARRVPLRSPWPFDPETIVFVVVLGGPLAGALAAAAARRLRLDAAAALLTTALALAVLPQALGRADWVHAIYAITPALILVGALFYGEPSRVSFAVALPLFACAVAAAFGPSVGLWRNAYVDNARARVAEIVRSSTVPGQPIFIGVADHGHFVVNEPDLYFVLDRPPATRYLQFDPGIVTRAEVQAEMIADLERRRPPLVIRSNTHANQEPWNASARHGSSLLDDYLNAHYRLYDAAADYQILTRAR